ncbi:hypothetical protein [Mesorhizobium australicum]|uniref:hypothetical protein n=1 Tax=Mesorhizobium australicum TaxID=536018 RepID=UPI00333A91FE
MKGSITSRRRVRGLHAGASIPSAMYLRTVLRSIPLYLAIADTDRPCRCKSSIIIVSPILITKIPLPTIRRSINDHEPPVSRRALRKTGDSAKLGVGRE